MPTPACRLQIEVAAVEADALVGAHGLRVPAVDIVRIERDAANWSAIVAGVPVIAALPLLF